MSYSVSTILHPHKDKNGLQKIQIMVIYHRERAYIKTDFRVKKEDFGNLPQKVQSILNKKKTEAEDILLDAIRAGSFDLKKIFIPKEKKDSGLHDYIISLSQRLKGRFSNGSLRHYISLANKIDGVKLSEISVQWLQRFEQKLREDLDGNTVNANMKRLKSILYKASHEGLIEESNFKRYKVPAYKQKIVEYLTEQELTEFAKIVKAVNNPTKKLSGYYYLLSAYTGWRISDCKLFNRSMIHGTRITLRAKKNSEIVSIPIHSRLKEVLKFLKGKSFDLSEPNVRIYVKEIASDAGIKKNVKFHSARHSFAMLLMANGFTIDEVAQVLGDSPLIARVYARIHNESLDKKIRERLG